MKRQGRPVDAVRTADNFWLLCGDNDEEKEENGDGNGGDDDTLGIWQEIGKFRYKGAFVLGAFVHGAFCPKLFVYNYLILKWGFCPIFVLWGFCLRG